MENKLTNFIKYCLGYVRLTRRHNLLSQQKDSVVLSDQYFSLMGLLNGDADGSLGEVISLEQFYNQDPLDIPKENLPEYKRERAIANKIEYIINKYRNDQFTKQIILSFGYFEIEILKEDELITEEENGDEDIIKIKNDINKQEPLFEIAKKEDSDNEPLVERKEQYPLFTLPIKIEKADGKYIIYYSDPDIQVSVSLLEGLLEENLYYALVEDIGKLEIEGKLSMPFLNNEILVEIWHKVKTQLKLKNVIFNEESFNLDEVRISIGPKTNYFLAEDLQKLTEIPSDEISDSSLTSWVENIDLNTDSGIPKENDLFFPFNYDKYKLQVLSVINNKAAIVQGPPGTGKSETIANLLCHLAATGNKVLFVSQKAQALKVVKDKLKKLDIKYLYGYIPNPLSTQLTEQDEIDGIAPQLAALSSYIQNMTYRVNSYYSTIEEKNDGSKTSIDASVQRKHDYINKLNGFINTEREVFALHAKFKELEMYSFEIENFDKFKNNFNKDSYKKLLDLKNKIKNLGETINAYEPAKEKLNFDQKLSSLNLLENSYIFELAVIKNDVSKTGYDRNSSLFRKISNSLRNMRLSSHRSTLPREIINIIDDILNKDLSRNEMIIELNNLYLYLNHFDCQNKLKSTLIEFEALIRQCGLNLDVLDQIYNLVENKRIEISEIVEKIADYNITKLKLYEYLNNDDNSNSITSKLRDADDKRRENIKKYIQNIIDKNIINYWKQGVKIKQIIQKLGKAFGHSKRAFKTFDNLRRDPSNFNTILDIIPIWVMELDDASRIIPLQSAMFDYVILDEASQCNIAYTLPSMFRAKKALFVGDSEQMRDNTVMFTSNRAFEDLARRYNILEDLQIKPADTAVQSVLEIAKLRGFTPIPLRYHYRSPNELIGFSNKYFYKPKGLQLIALNNNYLTYEDTNRIMLIHKIDSDLSEEISDKINVAEAKAILAFFKKIKKKEIYKDKSIGILTFFNPQATYLRELFEKEGYNEDKDNYRISIVEGIQGDEKDIIIYSFVIRDISQKNKYTPLTGEGGDLRGEINRGRVNVAFSRARMQVHCFISMDIGDIPDKIWIKRYLKYVEENGEVNFYSTKLKFFDSNFEQEFHALIKDEFRKNYIIQNQVESCGFKIDFVITNPKNNTRLAIECDGPTHFKDELDEEYGVYIESDEERQSILESAGWNFYRTKYSDWIDPNYKRDTIVKDIKLLLSK